VTRKATVPVLLKTVLPAAVGLVVLVLIIAWLAGVFTEKIPGGQTAVAGGEPDAGKPRETYVVEPKEKPYIEEAIGTLKAASRTVISSRVLARINRITVRAGDAVKKDDVLIELDQQDLDAKLSQAKAELAATDALVEQAQDLVDRAARVRQATPGAIPDQEFQKLNSSLQAALANQSRARQGVAEAEAYVSYATIRAPKSGTISNRFAEEGDTAQPGVPLLSLYDQQSLRLEVPVMENLAVNLHRGDKLTVHVDALKQDFSGVVDEKVPQAEAATRTFLIKVALPPSDDLYEGMFGRLEIPAGTRRHLCLHSGAVQRIGQLEFVQVVDPKTGKLERRFIKTGQRGYGQFVEVLSGLDEGETVVLQPSAAAPSGESSPG
jgi:membrane fusion protein (multidrug efflux system)